MNSKKQENQFSFRLGEFSIPEIKVQKRTPEEYNNDKKIFKEAERGYNGCYFLTKETYNKLSKQTQQELSQQTTYRGNIITISDSVINILMLFP